jgi:uncharacterized protein (DUF2147 family)
MKRFITAGMIILISAGTALAQSPVAAPALSPMGEWQVKDGTAHIRIANCGGAIWGVISWTKGEAGKDVNNPNPSLRDRSVMGMPILINMHPAGNRWDGQVYNAEDGQTYSSHISLVSPDVLSIEGCVLGGLICGGENWTRVPLPKGSPSDQAVCSRLPK